MRLVAFGPPVGCCAQPGGGAVVDKDRPLVDLVVVVFGRADKDIGKAVSVHVAGGGDRGAEPGACLGEHDLSVRLRARPRSGGWGGAQPRGGTVVDKDPSSALLVGFRPGCADKDIVVAITVDIAGGGHGKTKGRLRPAGHRAPIGGGAQPRGRAVVDKDRAFLARPVVVAGSADDHVIVAVTVDITGSGHGRAVVGGCPVGRGHPRSGGGLCPGPARREEDRGQH